MSYTVPSMDAFKTTYHYKTNRSAKERHNLTRKDRTYVPKRTQVRGRRYVDLQKRARATQPTAGWVKARDALMERDEASRVSMAAEAVSLNFSSFANFSRPERCRPPKISSWDQPGYPLLASRSIMPEFSRFLGSWRASPSRLRPSSTGDAVFSTYSHQQKHLLPSRLDYKVRLADAADFRKAAAALEKPSPFEISFRPSMSLPRNFYTQLTSVNIETLCEPKTESEDESYPMSKLWLPLLHETHSESWESTIHSKANNPENNFDTRYGHIHSNEHLPPDHVMYAYSDSAQSKPDQNVEDPVEYIWGTGWYSKRWPTSHSALSSDSDERSSITGYAFNIPRWERRMYYLLETFSRQAERQKMPPPKEARPVPIDYLELDPWVPFPCRRLLLQPQPRQREPSFNPISTQHDSRDLPEGYREVNSWPVNSIGHTSISTWKASAGRSKGWTVCAYLQHIAKGYKENVRPYGAAVHQLQCQMIRRTQTRSLRCFDTRSNSEQKFTASHLPRTRKKELHRKAYDDYSQLEASEASDTENLTREYSQTTLDDLTEPPKRILRLKIHNGMTQHDVSHGVIFEEGQNLDFQYSLGAFLQFDNHSDVYLAHDNRNRTTILHAHIFLSEELPGNWNTFVKRKMKRMRNNSSFVKEFKLARRPVIIQEVAKFGGAAPFKIKSMDAEFPPLLVSGK